ncbi:molecular chaperone (small heat shock protein) [Caulobacter sp. AP07]|nr:molecular chaperone (small heat shock protein) [Caulobacter sp. AP07]
MAVQDKSLLPAFTQQATHLFAPLQREIDRVVNEFGRAAGLAQTFSSPDLDFSETAQGVELKLDVPGYAEPQITVSLDGDLLTISGEKASQTEDGDKTYRIIERRSGAFTRSIALPRGVDGDKIKAALKDGVLTITAPKTASPAGKTIAIETPGSRAGA